MVVNYVYDAWGNHVVLDASGHEISDTEHIGRLNPFRYRGYLYDEETGLYFLQTRYYDPEIGRFITIDSIEYLDPDSINGINLYAYCLNNPVMCVDPTGGFAISAILIGALIGIIIAVTATAVADYTDDREVFNGSIGVESYVVNALIGGIIGAILGGLGASALTAAAPTASAIASSASGAAVAVSGAAVAEAAGAVIAVGGMILFSRIGKSGGYRIDHHYPNDHKPAHVHISGDNGTTKIDLNGNPLRGQRPMTKGESQAFKRLKEKIIRELKRWLRF